MIKTVNILTSVVSRMNTFPDPVAVTFHVKGKSKLQMAVRLLSSRPYNVEIILSYLEWARRNNNSFYWNDGADGS